MITEEEKRLMEEVRKNSDAYKKLQDKARWEHMSLFAVLAEWGDPRTWRH